MLQLTRAYYLMKYFWKMIFILQVKKQIQWEGSEGLLLVLQLLILLFFLLVTFATAGELRQDNTSSILLSISGVFVPLASHGCWESHIILFCWIPSYFHFLVPGVEFIPSSSPGRYCAPELCPSPPFLFFYPSRSVVLFPSLHIV